MMDAVELDGNNFQSYGDCIDLVVGGNNGDGSGTHHFWIINSSWHHCGQSGLQLNNSEWWFIIHNVWHDNALCSAGGGAPCTNSQGVWGSGLSLSQPIGNTDTRPTGSIGGSSMAQDNYWCISVPESRCFHNIVNFNVAYNNFNSQTGGNNLDGEGIIWDDWGHLQSHALAAVNAPISGHRLQWAT